MTVQPKNIPGFSSSATQASNRKARYRVSEKRNFQRRLWGRFKTNRKAIEITMCVGEFETWKAMKNIDNSKSILIFYIFDH